MKKIFVIILILAFLSGCSFIEDLGIKAEVSTNCTGFEIGTPEYGVEACLKVRTGEEVDGS